MYNVCAMEIKDKVVIVTGASSGIGKATAELFAKKGAKVALVARSNDKLEELAKNFPGSLVVTDDMSKEDEVKAMVAKVYKHFGRIDILINNAGQGYDALVEKINNKTFHYLFDLNVAGALIAMQEVIPIMRKQKGGAIVNISSGTALMYLPKMSPYSSLKRALVGISLTAREELKKDTIKVSVVYPYITETDFEKNTIKDSQTTWSDEEDDNFELPKGDSPKYVAKKILEAVTSGDAEVFAHDWMKNRRT